MNHRKVLGSYLGKISKSDFDAIIEAHENIWQQQANGNASSQRIADTQMYQAVEKAVNNLSSDAKTHIENCAEMETS